MCTEVLNRAEFKWKPLTLVPLSGDTYLWNAKKQLFHNGEHSSAASFTLQTRNMVEGGRYQLKITKTTAGDITMTLPGDSVLTGSAVSASILLTGPINSVFIYDFTYKP